MPVLDAETGGEAGHAGCGVAAGDLGDDAVRTQRIEQAAGRGTRLLVEMEGCDGTVGIRKQQGVGGRGWWQLAAGRQREVGATRAHLATVDLAAAAGAGPDLYRLRA